jgi:hypothetical protein
MRSQPAITLSADDVKFLGDCGVLQEDIKVIPKLPSAGQRRILLILRFDGRECNDLKIFKDCRNFLRKFTPPPNESPWPPVGWTRDFVTLAEGDYISKVNKEILDRINRN